MRQIQLINQMRSWAEEQRTAGRKIGFVPTLGALHEGHLSLVREAVKDNDLCVVSIFVNPLQFGKGEDYQKYPRELASDRQKLEEEGVNVLFAPAVAELYPEGCNTTVRVKGITGRLCGRFRPGHFEGVTTIVTKLFNLVRPHRVYFGKKDYQQLLVIKRLVKDLNLGIEVIGMPIVRDQEGLALSSRNSYLDPEAKRQTHSLSRALTRAKTLFKQGINRAEEIKKELGIILAAAGVTDIDYISICDPLTLEEVREIQGETLIALAVRIKGTRLIDNCIIGGKGAEDHVKIQDSPGHGDRGKP